MNVETLRHVPLFESLDKAAAHELCEMLESLGAGIEAEHANRSARLGEQAEEDADERALAGAVGADEADDAGLDVDRQAVEGGDTRVALGQLTGADQGHLRGGRAEGGGRRP